MGRHQVPCSKNEQAQSKYGSAMWRRVAPSLVVLFIARSQLQVIQSHKDHEQILALCCMPFDGLNNEHQNEYIKTMPYMAICKRNASQNIAKIP